MEKPTAIRISGGKDIKIGSNYISGYENAINIDNVEGLEIYNNEITLNDIKHLEKVMTEAVSAELAKLKSQLREEKDPTKLRKISESIRSFTLEAGSKVVAELIARAIFPGA